MTDDHLAVLSGSSSGGASRGQYRPGRFDLSLGGEAELVDRLVHYHEAQHVILNVSTAWGAAVLVASEVPGWQGLHGRLLDRCRTVHEAFAAYQSTDILEASFGSANAALAAYPDYVLLVERLDRFLAPIVGPQRRSLAASAVLRACMQTPILDLMLAAWPEPVSLGAVKRLDIPDERLETLLREPDRLAAWSGAADEAITAGFGAAAVIADLRKDGTALDDEFDDAWALWEETVFEGAAALLREADATVVDTLGHLKPATDLADRLAQVLPGAAFSVAAPDSRLGGLVLSHARLWLDTLRRPAVYVTVGRDVGLGDVVEVAGSASRIGGRPNLVLAARSPARLLSGYEFSAADAVELSEVHGPAVVVRSVADNDDGVETVWIARLPRPQDATGLAALWGDDGDVTCCVAVSCLIDPGWREAWLPALGQAGPLVWLIDVGAATLDREFAGRQVRGLILKLDPAAGARRAVAFRVSGTAGLWLAAGDDVGVESLVQEIAALPDVDLLMTGADWTPVLPTLRLVLLDLLRTESYLDLRGRVVEGRQ